MPFNREMEWPAPIAGEREAVSVHASDGGSFVWLHCESRGHFTAFNLKPDDAIALARTLTDAVAYVAPTAAPRWTVEQTDACACHGFNDES